MKKITYNTTTSNYEFVTVKKIETRQDIAAAEEGMRENELQLATRVCVPLIVVKARHTKQMLFWLCFLVSNPKSGSAKVATVQSNKTKQINKQIS